MTAQRIKLLFLALFLSLFLFASGDKAKAQACGMICPAPLTSCTNQSICDAYEPLRQETVCVASEPCHNEWVCVSPYSYEADVECPPCQDYTDWECLRWEERWDRRQGDYSWDCVGGWNPVQRRSCNTCRQTISGCNQHSLQCVGGGCIREETRSVGGGCITSHIACLGGGICPTNLEEVACPNPTPSCVADTLCILPDGSNGGYKCYGYQCPAGSFPTKPAPGCNQIGEPYPISEPGKCARNCTSADGVTNLWDYVDCAPGTNPPPAQNCPATCGYPGGWVRDGVGGQKACPVTPVCPVDPNNPNQNPNNLVIPIPTPAAIATSSFFQVQDAGVMAQSGGIVNRMPVGTTLSKGVAGVIIGNGASNFGSGHASSTNWVAGSDLDNTGVISGKLNYRYDYDYVSGRIISTIKPNPGPNFVVLPSQLMVEPAQDYGIYWTKVTGDLDINSNLDFGTNRVVVLVEGNANIKGKINFTKNEGLFALYVKGNINIDSSVGAPGAGIDPTGLPAHIEGLYLAQGSFNTGASASQLRLEGAFVGIGGVNLQRNLNSAWPSEYFVFRPDILMNLPKQLLRQNHQWQELAP